MIYIPICVECKRNYNVVNLFEGALYCMRHYELLKKKRDEKYYSKLLKGDEKNRDKN